MRAHQTNWRENALAWIDDEATRLSWPVPTDCGPVEPTAEARVLTILILRATPDDLPPLYIDGTRAHGVSVKWRHGQRELDLEVLADATLEISTWECGELIAQDSFESCSLWRLCLFFAWLRKMQ